jgi:hypothetical protein
MKKLVFALAVFMLAVPALADVDISCSATGLEVTVSYNATTEAPELVRAFALEVDVNNGATIDSVTYVNPNYRIYPGQIVIVDGNVTDYNTPYVPGTLGSSSLVVEMGSLYTEDANYSSDPNAGYGLKPGASGTIFKFTVSGACHVTTAENAARGGVVMEDPQLDVDVNLTGCQVTGPPPCTCPGNVSGDTAQSLPPNTRIDIMDAATIVQWIQLYGSKGKIACDWTPPGW